MKRILIAAIFAVSAWGQGTALPVNTWVHASIGGYPAGQTAYDKSIYDPVTKRHYWWGPYHLTYSEQDTCIQSYSYEENRADVLDCSGLYHTAHMGPGGHTSGLFAYDSLRHLIYYDPDQSSSNMGEVPDHMFAYDLLGVMGLDRLAAPVANPRPFNQTSSLSSMVYDPWNDKMVLFPDINGHTRIYDPVTNLWSDPGILANQPPTNLANFNFIYNPVNHLIYAVFGATAGTFNTGVYAFNAANNTWQTVTMSGGPPTGRRYAGGDYSSVDNVFLFAGGNTSADASSGFLQEMWTLTNTSGTATSSLTATWTQLTPSGTWPTFPAFEKFSYDQGSNAFVYLTRGNNTTDYSGGAWGADPIGVYLYALSPALNYGRVTNTYAPSTGWLNRNTSSANSQSHAMHTTMAANGSTLYLGWIETSAPFVTNGSGFFPHPYVVSTTGTGTFANVSPSGSPDYLAIDSDAAGSNMASDPRLAYVNSVPWVVEEKSNNGGMLSMLWAKQWTGSAWTGLQIGPSTGNHYTITGATWAAGQATFTISGTFALSGSVQYVSGVSPSGWNGACAYLSSTTSTVTCAMTSNPGAYVSGGTLSNANAYQGISRILGVGTVPTIAFLEWSKDAADCSNAQASFAFVDSWDGTKWNRQSGKLNRTTTCSRAESIDATTDGTNTIVAWVESVTSGQTALSTNPQVFVSSVAPGGTITPLGGVLNQNTSNYALDVSITYMGGQPYVAWTERTPGGNPQLYVKTFSSGVWSLVGSGSLNRNTIVGWPTNPHLTNDGTNLFLQWEEQQNRNQPNRGYVMEYTGGAWSLLGGAVNMDPVNGSMNDSAFSMYNGQPTMAWTEATLGNLHQVYAARWDGASQWVSLNTVPPPSATGGSVSTGIVSGKVILQ